MKAKWCWLARQYRKGWRVGLCVGESAPQYLDVWFDSPKDVENVLHQAQGKVVFVEMATNRRHHV